jgi:hypothetical protein
VTATPADAVSTTSVDNSATVSTTVDARGTAQEADASASRVQP